VTGDVDIELTKTSTGQSWARAAAVINREAPNMGRQTTVAPAPPRSSNASVIGTDGSPLPEGGHDE